MRQEIRVGSITVVIDSDVTKMTPVAEPEWEIRVPEVITLESDDTPFVLVRKLIGYIAHLAHHEKYHEVGTSWKCDEKWADPNLSEAWFFAKSRNALENQIVNNDYSKLYEWMTSNINFVERETELAEQVESNDEEIQLKNET